MEKIVVHRRFFFVDMVKGMAILLVVLGHLVQSNDIFMGDKESLQYKWIYLFHMGLFFACSGYLYNWKEDVN